MKNNDRSKIEALLVEAWIERGVSDYQTARALAEQAHGLCGDKDHRYLGRIFHIYMQFEADHGNYHMALQYCKTSVEHYSKSGSNDRIAHATRHMADLLRHLKQYNKAEVQYKRLLKPTGMRS